MSSKNFTIKQIGSMWRVVGPGGKLIDGQYRLKQQALKALKLEVDKLLQERNFGFLKETSIIIEKEIENEIKATNGPQNDEKDGKISEGQEVRQERLPSFPKKGKNKRKKVVNCSPNVRSILEKHNL